MSPLTANVLFLCLIGGEAAVTEEPRANNKCGQISFWALATVLGKELTWEEVKKVVPASENGTSASELIDAGRRFSLNLHLIRRKEGSEVLPRTPFIAHLETPFFPEKFPGHYVVVLESNGQGITYYEPSQGMTDTTSRDHLLEKSSGYFIVPQKSRTVTPLMFTLGFASVLVVRVIFMKARQRHG